MSEEKKGRRVTVDMSPAAASEIDKILELTGGKTSDLFRQAFSLLHMYVSAIRQGKEIMIANPNRLDEPPVKVELLFPTPITSLRNISERVES